MTITGFGQLHHSSSINRQRQINKYTILLAYDLMQFGRENLQPVTSPLIDFARDKVHPIGTIDLPITAGIPPIQTIVMVSFLVVNCPSAYNAILGRTSLNKMKVIRPPIT
jgi:hypothetical protein